MSRLAPPRIDRRFQDLMALGRAQLPALSPEWTDHNAHDPGITLMELLAWVAEAQLYAVGHTRRDERTAYAALVGLRRGGTRPAQGLVWPDVQDPRAPARTYAESVVIPADAIVNAVNAQTPTFRPAHKLLWIPGEMRGVTTRRADGRIVDHTAVNAREGPGFAPFGDAAGPRDVFAIDFECRGEGGVFPPTRTDADDAVWTLGVRTAAPLRAEPVDTKPQRGSPLEATLVTDTNRFPVAIVSDTTAGLLRTGALSLDLSKVAGSPRRFTLELRAARGLARPPQVLRIAPNVVPVVQGRPIAREAHVATTGWPDWSFRLDVPGLRFESGEEPIALHVIDASGRRTRWQRCDRLEAQGPDDAVFALDVANERITFGNGINGRAPREGDQVIVAYAVCDGENGGVARHRSWRVQGFEAVFGTNVDPIGGGRGPDDWRAQRRESRRRTREDHALVSVDDIAAAALALPLLDVDRAWVVPPTGSGPDVGTITLVAMRGLRAGEGAARVPETRRWLDAIRRRLLAGMPLGTRLRVAAPRYVPFAVQATIEAEAGRDVDKVRNAVMDALRVRLATTGAKARAPGVPVSRGDVAGWIRAVEGVARVVSWQLVRENGARVEQVVVTRDGLPRFDESRSTLVVRRPGGEGAP
jgi:predicted phage baseplate assembly protein